jgi:hypothetical protein
MSIICRFVACCQRPKKHRFDPEKPNGSDKYCTFLENFHIPSGVDTGEIDQWQRMGLVRRVSIRIFRTNRCFVAKKISTNF